ncbi:MAG: M14 family zinc carboxypeptidase [candidate division Zixibacteria bacterium]|jgi:hypothetical protein|nr:M14 family zinc carboxypeptidase [candidate division Zixibacteria bacterium]
MHLSSRLLITASAVALSVLVAPELTAGLHPSYSEKAIIDTVPFYDTESYDPAIPNPNDYLQHPVGQWPNHYHEIVAYARLLAEKSDRVMIDSYGSTHEGRELIYLIISTPENLARLEQYRDAMSTVADPAALSSSAELDRLIADLPAFAWMAYSIHGDEVSGTDAATRLIWHLAAATDSATMHLLQNVIVLVDPSENPDGRERYLSMLQTYKSHTPNYDPGAMQHSGVWPWGRTNHYWFDLNRDWILLTQPETKGRVETILKYFPVLVVDGHEMGSSDNFLFSPPRQPINYNTPENVLKWYQIYGREQAQALDLHGWPYYTGEWNEQWYIGYGSSWPTLFGSVGILYEQAGVDGNMVRQPGDYILTYHEAVNHQFTSSIANLRTTANHRVELLRDYHNARKAIVMTGRQSGLTFLFPPGSDHVKLNRFVRSLMQQGIDVSRTTASFTLPSARNTYGETVRSRTLPAGTFVVSTAQPHGALAKAICEFDLRLNQQFLEDERRELEKHGDTRMYEVSAWCVPMAYGLEAYETTSAPSVSMEPVTDLADPTGRLVNPDATYGFLIDMEGEQTYRILNRLFAKELIVYASEKPLTIEGREYAAGTLLLRQRGNPDNLADLLGALAEEIGVNVYGVSTGYASQGSHLGAPTFQLLAQPRIALVAGSPIDYTDAGSLWFTIDKELEIPHSLINMQQLTWTDLSPYNVLVIPDAWGSSLEQQLGRYGASMLSDWVSDGGTLILMGSSAAWAADTATGLSSVRLRRQVLDQLDSYAQALKRELSAESPAIDTLALWYPEKAPAENAAAEQTPGGGPGNSAEELDEWNRRFHPRGVIMRADVDTEHWLAYGMSDRVPVMVYTDRAFLSKDPVTTVARFAPDGNRLRMSGLLWPEARERWAGTAYLTRERKGKGQVIMFAAAPYTRAYFYGTRQMFVNALLYGPGYTSSLSPYGE